MSTPGGFGDIGKSAGDLFKKGFNFGQVKLEASSVSKSNCEFKAVTSSEGSRIFGSLEAKTKCPKHGATGTAKWNTDNAFNLNLAVENQFVDGLKVTLDSTISPHSGKKSHTGKVNYKRPYFNGTMAVNKDNNGTVISGEDVFCYDKFIGGASYAYNVSSGQCGGHTLLFGYDCSDFAATAGVSNFASDKNTEISASLFHRPAKNLHAAAQARHVVGAVDGTTLEVATKYTPDCHSTVQAKVSTRGRLGLSYGVNVSSGIKLTLSSMIDAMHLDQPNHRLGLAIDLSGK